MSLLAQKVGQLRPGSRVRFERAVTVMAETFRDAPTAVRHVVLVIHDPERVEEARAILQQVLGTAVTISRSENEPESFAGSWLDDEEARSALRRERDVRARPFAAR